MRNPMSVERALGPNRNDKENYGDVQPIARNMKPTLWVLGETCILVSSITINNTLTVTSLRAFGLIRALGQVRHEKF